MRCKQCQKDFTIYPEDQAFYRKLDVPEPTLCLDCRHKLRYLFRNERSLYLRQCDLCHKDMISIYSPDNKYQAYCHDCYNGDKWGGEEYGRDYDFNRSFFEQFEELKLKVPRLGLDNHQSENSEYSNIAVGNKNCYLIFGTIYSENSCYSRKADRLKESLDIEFGKNLELCYELVDCYNCYNLIFSHNCNGCSFSGFLYDCIDCKNCWLCSNLRHAEYCYLNQQLTKEEYEKRVDGVGSVAKFKEYKELYAKLKLGAIHRSNNNFQSEDCLGDYLVSCKNCFQCFDLNISEDCRYCTDGLSGVEASMDCSSTAKNSNNCFECASCSDTKYSCFSASCREGNMNLYYSEGLLACNDCFGCVGLKNKKFYILNKAYSQTEYEQQKNKVISQMKQIGEWGKFFPAKLSPFAYNESIVYDIYPLSREAALQAGFSWREKNARDSKKQSYQIPENIKDVGDDILKEILACTTCGKNYKVVALELGLYRKLGVPVPNLCSDCRHYVRNQSRNSRVLYHRSCMNAGCHNEFETTYAPDRLEKVYCEECYQKEIY